MADVEEEPAATAPAAKTPAKPPYEKVLLLAKQLKAQNQRLTAEKEAGEKAAGKVRQRLLEAENKIFSLSSKTTPPVPAQAAPAAAPADTSDAMLFWDLVAQGRVSPLQLRLSKVAVQALVSSLSRSRLGGQRLLLAGDAATGCAFLRWRRHAAQAREAGQAALLEEARVAQRELEGRAAKLKQLLARTHQANKQQAEDVQSQRAATAASRQSMQAHTAEKEALLEQVRATTLERAFQEDMELRIQRAAETVSLQHQRRRQQEQQQQEETSTPSSPAAGPEAAAALEGGGAEEEAAALRQLLAAQAAQLEAAAGDVQSLRAELQQAQQTAQQQARGARDREEGLQQRLEEGRLQRQELELELELTVKTRGSALSAADSLWAQRQQKAAQEGQASLRALQAQLAAETAECGGLRLRLAEREDELGKLRASNSALQRSRGETQSLRMQLVALRRAVKGGREASGAGDNLPPNASAAAAAAAEEVARVREEGAANWGALRDAGIAACRRAISLASAAAAAQADAAASRHALHDLLHALLDKAAACVAGSVPGSVSSASSSDYVKISGLLRDKEQSLLGRLAVLQEQEELEEPEEQEEPPHAAPQRAAAQDEAPAPLQWDSSSLELSSGGRVEVVLPALAPGQAGQLKWSLTGSAGSIKLALLPAEVGGLSLPAVPLPSQYVARDESYCGELQLEAAGSACRANRVLRVENAGWTGASIGYSIRMQRTVDPRAREKREHEREQQAVEMQQHQQQQQQRRQQQSEERERERGALEGKLRDTRHKLRRFLGGCDLHFRCLGLRAALLQAELGHKRAPQAGEGEEEEEERGVGAFSSARLLAESQAQLAAFTELAYRQGQGQGQGQVAKTVAAAPVRSAATSDTEYTLLDKMVGRDCSIAASKSLTLPLPFSRCAPPYLLRWSIELLGNSAGRNVGFCVCRLMRDGSLPLLLPYRKLTGSFRGEYLVTEGQQEHGQGEDEQQGVAVLLDNTYSWVNGKDLHYAIEMLSLEPQPQGPQAEVEVPDAVMWDGEVEAAMPGQQEAVEEGAAAAAAAATADDINVAAAAAPLAADFVESSSAHRQALLQALQEALQFAGTYGHGSGK